MARDLSSSSLFPLQGVDSAVHLDAWTDLFDGVHEPQSLTTALKNQQLRPKFSLDVNHLKAIPGGRHREFSEGVRVNFASSQRQDGERSQSAARQVDRFRID